MAKIQVGASILFYICALTSSTDIAKKLAEITGGADYVVECTGAAPCIKTGWECLGSRGAYAGCGTPGPGPTANIGIHDAILLTKKYHGVCEGDSNPPEFVPKLVQLYKDGKFPVDKISKVYDYKELGKAIHDMHDGSVIKPIIVFA